MKYTLTQRLLKTALVIGASLGAVTLQASTTLNFSVDMATNILNGTFTPGTDQVFVQGTFNGWSPFVELFQKGSSTVYTNSSVNTGEVGGPVTKYQFVRRNSGVDTYETSADFNLRAAVLPTTSGGSLVLPTPFFNDAGAPVTNSVKFSVDMSQQIALGNFVPGTSTIEVRGNFNGWTGGATPLTLDPTVVRVNQYGLMTTNVYTNTVTYSASTNAAMDYKYVITTGALTSWDSPAAVNRDNGGNRFFVNDVSKNLPVVDFSDSPYAPIANIKFVVDMTVVWITDPAFNPTTVTVNGDFNGWSTGIACTNDPLSSNTNLYTSSIIQSGAGSTINYQFRYSNGGTVYDSAPGGGNRQFLVPNIANTNLPAVFFNNVSTNDLLNVDTVVTFTVNMTNAVGTDAHAFDPVNDTVYINGDFSGWLSWNPISLGGAGLNCTNNPPGSMLYSYQRTFAKNQPRSVTYKYAINGVDDEAGFGQNHFRYIRSTTGSYTMPVDTFGNQYGEPKFGNLAAGAKTGGYVPITWLGYPGVYLQNRSSLTTGSWATSADTSVSSGTNWPAATGSQFFRMIQPNP